MPERTQLTAVETVHEYGSWLFTVRDQYGELDEVLLVPCEDEGEDADGDEEANDGRDADSEQGTKGEQTDEQDDDPNSPGEDGVEAWVNRCTHEAQRLDRGFGAPMRNGEIICPKHGSMFDACSGYCDNGKAADTTLVSVEVSVEGGTAYLTDDDYEFSHEGSIEDGDGRNESEDDDDDTPSSTSHIGL